MILDDSLTGVRIPSTVALLRRWIDADECLGGQLFAWQDDQVIADLAVGRSGLARNASAADTGRLYCAVKPLAACCLARAVAAGHADFNDPVSRYLPRFSSAGRERITLRHLLGHSSGMRNWNFDPYERGFHNIVRIASTYPLSSYSWYARPKYNEMLAWYVLAAAVEKIYDMDFAAVVTQVISKTVRLPGLCITTPDAARYVRCHVRQRGSFAEISEPAESTLFSTVDPAHGGFGSARDLGLFYSELVRCATNGGKLLDRECIREITRKNNTINYGLGSAQRPYGLGFMVSVADYEIGGNWSQSSFGHAGYAGSYCVLFAFGDPEHRVAAAIRLFSAGAKNNWRFDRLGKALWSDLALR